jgi:protein SCO1/2
VVLLYIITQSAKTRKKKVRTRYLANLIIFTELQEQQKKSVGKAKIGGPFTLVDQNGKPVTDAMYRERFMAIYFGFTNCPDICPTELKRLSNVLQILDADPSGIGRLVQPIFISIDPNRDTVAQVREYVSGVQK